jgi:putative glutamine amidotransferase
VTGPTGPDRPVIGLSAYATRACWGVWDADAALLPQAYLDCVVRAGGVPVLLPPLPGLIDSVLPRLDGLLIAGGPDVDPARYGERPGPDTQPPSRSRDAAELDLLAAAEGLGLPVLGICRGMQLLNVARGGSLLQHLPEVVGTDLHAPGPGRYGRHPVSPVAGTLLARLLGGAPVPVPTYHHQGVDRLGERLVVAALAEDGVIEAVEDPARPFFLGVQWHPEVGEDLALFRALVAEASRVDRAARAGRAS